MTSEPPAAENSPDEPATAPGDTENTPVVRHEPIALPGKGESCLVVIYGADLGRRIPLSTSHSFAIGRAPEAELPLDQDSVSRQHARIVWGETEGFVLFDAGSTNGTYVNDHVVTRHTLRHGDQIKIGRSILKFMTGNDIETSYHEEIYRLMTVDGLTQVHNKRYFHDTLEREFNRARRYRRPLSLVLLDIDHFKQKNDTYGHVAGDALLRALATLIQAQLRREDIFARVGGEEFGALLPEVSLEGARVTAERIREVVEKHEFTFDATTIALTVSCGVATLEDAFESATSLYGAADAALYAAKELGRNRIEG